MVSSTTLVAQEKLPEVMVTEQNPMANMEFFIFLADSITNDEELTTPLDLENIDLESLQPNNQTTEEEQE